MYYKGNQEANTRQTRSEPTDMRVPRTTSTYNRNNSSTEERNDSGLGSMEFSHSESSLEMTSNSSLGLDSIAEVESEKEPIEQVNNINGQFSHMNIGSSTDNGSGGLSSRCDRVHHDSGLDNCFQRSSSSCEHSEQSNTASHRAILDLISSSLHLCFRSEDGEVCMEHVLRLYQGNQDGDNGLNFGILHGHEEAAMLLIAMAPDYEWLNLYNNLRQTPLHLAVMTGQAAIVRRLVCAGADITVQDLIGNTPLHWACSMGLVDVVKQFLSPVRHTEAVQNVYKIPFQKLPQDMSVRNFEGDTCLHLAARAGHLNVVALLLDSGTDPNVGDGKTGRSVLHHAAEAGHVTLTSLLLNRRETRVDLDDYARYTPYDLAWGRQRLDVMRILVSRGAVPRSVWRGDHEDTDDDDNDDMMNDVRVSG